MLNFDKNNHLNYYHKALDGLWARHNAISGNISNVNTPGYKRKEVYFQDQLKSEINKKGSLSRTNNRHIGSGGGFTPLTVVDRSHSYRLDGNNVNIDVESTELAKNTIMYDAISRQMSSEFEKIKNVIAEGSK